MTEATETTAPETEAPEKSFWALREDNEWEGETWVVYFEVPAEHLEAMRRLRDLIDEEGDESHYELRRVKEIPLIEEPEAELDDESEDDDYDEDFDEEPNSYHPAKSVYDFQPERLALTLGYYEGQGWDSGEDDPLYKLGFFQKP